MSLAEGIHQRWAATGALHSLLPAANVYTGLSVDPIPPYAVITKNSDRPAQRYNDRSSVDMARVRIETFHSGCESALALMEQIKAAFDGADFALSGGGQVIDMRRVNDFQRQHDDGIWRSVIDFDCTIHQV